MATKRWSANLGTLLAKKNNEVLLGGGHDDHIPSGYNVDTDTYRLRGALRFALTWSGVGQIVSATLSVKTTTFLHVTGSGSDPDIYVERIVQSWSTNNDRSSFDSSPGSGWTGDPADFGDVVSISTGRATADITTSANTWDTVDITDIVEAWAPSTVKKRDGTAGGAQHNYGVLIKPVVAADTSENTEFYGIGPGVSATNKPTILLTYTSSGSAPSCTVLSPTGTIVRSVPNIAGTFTDADAGDTQSKLDIQVSTDSTFASTVWDVVQTTVFTVTIVPGWFKAYGGSALIAGTLYYIRARVYDQSGNASDWSPTVSFTLANYGGGITPKPPAFRRWPARIELYATTTGRGIGTLKAVIDDAKNVGVSAYANEVGEAYFTLPYNHPQIAEIVPLQRHYRVSRYDAATGAYKTIGRGLLDDFDADQDEVVVYGSDYMSFLETSITAASTTYTNATLGSIVLAELSAAINEDNSRMGFTTATAGSGQIENTSTTATLITAFQQRLQFLQQVANVSMASSSVRTIFSLPRDSPFAWKFIENQGSEEITGVRLEYGGNINGFRYMPGFRGYRNRVQAIGVRREGASILYSTQSAGDASVYGRMTMAQLFQDVNDQTALDKMTSRQARVAANLEKNLALILRASKIIPWDGFDLGDSLRAHISRGTLVNLNSLYTLWSLEWTLNPEGVENLYLGLASKLT